MTAPWSDWIPGVLGKNQMTSLLTGGFLLDATADALDHSSIDLHLSTEAYRLAHGSIKPNGKPYLHFLKQANLVTELESDSGVFTLEPRTTYIVKLRERLAQLQGSKIYGQATAKSSVGRVDVLARLIVDGMDGYEGFRPDSLSRGSGDMFLEITPITFRIAVKEGTALSQLRFFYGPPGMSEVTGPELWGSVLLESTVVDGMLSVDLRPVEVAGVKACAFRAEAMSPEDPPIRLWRHAEPKPNPKAYWKLEQADIHERLEITKGSFYILRSLERIALPKGIAVYCRAIDETIGEMRIHYAGFVHPFFGRDRGDHQRGTPLIFEVRGHDVDVNLIHGEKMARMTFYRLSEDAVADLPASPDHRTYNEQTLKLSTFFADWT